MKRYRWFVQNSTFLTALNNGEIGVDDICFILDKLRIYTRSNSFTFSNRPIYQGENTSNVAGIWTASIDGITEISEGTSVKIKIGQLAATTSYNVLNINSLGNLPVWYRYGVPLTKSDTPVQDNAELLLTYRATASSTPIEISGTSYSGGWVVSGANPEFGGGLKNTSGTIELDFGNVDSANTTKPVTGKSVRDAIPSTTITSASVSGTTLTLTPSSGSEVVYSHPTNTATTITTTDGHALGSITVDGLGHVTSVADKTLAATDIPNLSGNKITTDKPTTISGYGITDAKIESGTITLGANTISSETAASAGTTVSLATTGEKYTWNGKQDNVSALGTTTKPVYTSAAGTFAECSDYAGGTAVTLNGTSKAADTASLYAPTDAGTSGQILKSAGSGAPTWDNYVASYDHVYTAISNPSGNPSSKGWYELSDGTYILSEDTSVVSGKTYYKQESYYEMTF